MLTLTVVQSEQARDHYLAGGWPQLLLAAKSSAGECLVICAQLMAAELVDLEADAVASTLLQLLGIVIGNIFFSTLYLQEVMCSENHVQHRL